VCRVIFDLRLAICDLTKPDKHRSLIQSQIANRKSAIE
jgi:hypothetical protein